MLKSIKQDTSHKKKHYENSLLGEVEKVKDALLDEKFKPSVELKNILNKQIKRAVYPIEVAIIGQFSSGKSTFLNALLSKDILPTGITPVTSKVIYINYGETHRLKVTYRSGVHEYHPLENIAHFSDQRIAKMDEIKYLTIYAPVERLKEMSFVDTPGLNSQSSEDTQSTRKVFNDVGGIIWLTLMDNAGKRSEEEILDRYMAAFKTKSLCILNQKDKFTQAQIDTSRAYIEEKFKKYFSKVIPISAKEALDARALQPAVLIDTAMNRLIKEFKTGLQENPLCDSLQFFSDDFTSFQDEVEKIKALDMSRVEENVQDSNINEVLAYIENEMRPNADALKAFRIKNDLKNICDILMNAYHTMIAVYDALNEILEVSQVKNLEKLTQIEAQYASDLEDIYRRVEQIFQNVASDIYENIKVKSVESYKESTSAFLHQHKIEKYKYDSFTIDRDSVLNALFFNDNKVENTIKILMKKIETFEANSNNELQSMYISLQKEVTTWQHKYLLLSKNREISSDLEFSQVKRFASKVYENILNTFHTDTLQSIEALNKKSAYLNGVLSYNFIQTVQVTMTHMEEKILASETVFKNDPEKYTVYRPGEADILERLKLDFSFERFETMLLSPNSYLHGVIKESKKRLLETTENKKHFIEKEKAPFLEKIKKLKSIKESILHNNE